MHELPFFDELSIAKVSHSFKIYGRNYEVEIIDFKDPLAQLESRIKDLFKDLLNEMKDFKYQITVKNSCSF